MRSLSSEIRLGMRPGCGKFISHAFFGGRFATCVWMALSLTPGRDFPADLRCISLPESRRRLFCLLLLAFCLPHPISRVANSFTPNEISAKYYSAKSESRGTHCSSAFVSRADRVGLSSGGHVSFSSIAPLRIRAVTRALLKRIHYGFYGILRITNDKDCCRLEITFENTSNALILDLIYLHNSHVSVFTLRLFKPELEMETVAHSDVWY